LLISREMKMLSHLLAGSLLLWRHRLWKSLEQGCRGGIILACPGEHRGALPLFGDLTVDLTRSRAGGSSIGVTGKFALECHAFLLQLELRLLELSLTSEELCPLQVCRSSATLHRHGGGGWVC